MDKKQGRLRRAKKTRMKSRELQTPRLVVFRTPKHIYAQIIDPQGQVLAATSTLSKDIRKSLNHGGNVNAAKIVGTEIAKKVKKLKLTKIAFDRSGYRYHGRVQALADAAREGGVEF